MEIKEYGELSADMKLKVMGWTNSLNRGNAIPLDDSSIYASYDAAVTYINTAKTAYEGQLIAVKNNGVQEVYVVDKTATDGMRKLASGGSADEIATKLTKLSSELLSTPNGYIPTLSAKDSELSTAIETLSTNLSTDLKTEIENREANDEYLSTEIGDLSTDLSNAITAEAEARKENDDYLSTQIKTVSSDLSDAIEEERKARISSDEALSTEIETLSTNLSTDLSAEIDRAEKAEAQVLADAKTYTNEVSTALSTDYVQKIADLSGMLSTAWHFVGVTSTTETLSTGALAAAAYDTNAKNGDIVIVNMDTDGDGTTTPVEFVYDANGKWQQLGDESSNVSKYVLNNAITGLSATVSAEIDHDVEALSTSLSNEVDAKLKTEKEAREAKDDALSTEIENLSTALSTEISALEQSANEELKEVSAVLSTAIEEEKDARIAADEKLSTDLTTEIKTLSANLSTDLEKEIAERKAADTVISTAVDSKIKVQDGDNATAVSVGTMTIHKISEAKYAELLSTDGGIISSDLYIVSSDNLNAHDHAIINVLSGTEDTDAVNVAQLNAAIESANGEVTTLSNYLLSANGYIDQVSSNLYAHTDAASAYAFEQANNYTSATVSADLYTRISGVSSWTENTVSANLYAHADAASAEALSEAKEYTDEVSGKLSAELSIELETTAGTGDILSAYTLKQGGNTIGTINIPKDKVVSAASVVSADDGTYLKLTIQNGDVVSVAVPELVNTYAGGTTDTISVNVTDGTGDGYRISAEVLDESITHEKLALSSVTSDNLSGEFIFDCGDASGYTA